MVQDVCRSEPSHTNYDEDLCEVSSLAEDDNNEDGVENAIVLHDDNKDLPNFGSIAVNNSTDIHFGNKNFYQGPVTIKQFLYASEKDQNGLNSVITDCNIFDKNGKENGGYQTDSAINGFNSIIDKVHLQTDVDKIDNDKYNPVQKWLNLKNHKHLLIIAILVIAVIVLSITGVAVFLAKRMSVPEGHIGIPVDSTEQDIGTPIDGPFDPNVNLTLSGKLKIISRLEWVAQPPVDALDLLKLPVPYVIIMHTATENCSDQAACTFHARFIQTFHIESRHWFDIGYNFMVGGDGYAYEGRGWKNEGAHTYGYNARSIGIAFIGTFNNILPPARQILAAKQLIEKGLELGFIAKDYKILAARQLQTTQSPGKVLYEDMKNWPHWSPSP